MSQHRARRSWPALLVISTAVLILGWPAIAQDAIDVSLRDARLAPDGQTRLVLGIEGLSGTTLDSDDFTILEDGQPIAGVEARPLLESGVDLESVVTILALDTSSSMAGEPIERIREAATTTARTLTDAGTAVGVIEFNTLVTEVNAPTTSGDELADAIGGLEATGGTALYNAIIFAVERFENLELTPNLVVFADGEDTLSGSSLEDAVAAANEAEIPLTVILLATDLLDLAVLEPLASQTGGRLLSVDDASELDSLFAAVATDITNQYVLTYTSSLIEPRELPVAITVQTPDGERRVDSLVINSRQAAAIAPPPPAPSVFAPPPLAAFSSSVGLWTGIATAFLAALLLLWVVLVSTRRSAGSRSLEQGLQAFGRSDRRSSSEDLVLPTSRFTERAIDLIARIPKPRGFDQRLQFQLDRAAWPIRSNEFVVLSAASGLLGGLFTGWLGGNLILGVVGALVAASVPTVVMWIKVQQRRKRFVDQLPATLQLLAGSLRAGYGLLQAIDTVVKEAEDPTSTEFARVLTEARLGMAIDESLEGMAQRLESEDFHWVVLAIGIQRDVGGNLAELLATVAGTMRNRAALRRQIRTLSAEGRISAWVIGLMPFIVAVALQIINPGYIAELFQRVEGLVMLAGGAVLLIAGGFWLKRIVNIEVT